MPPGVDEPQADSDALWMARWRREWRRRLAMAGFTPQEIDEQLRRDEAAGMFDATFWRKKIAQQADEAAGYGDEFGRASTMRPHVPVKFPSFIEG